MADLSNSFQRAAQGSALMSEGNPVGMHALDTRVEPAIKSLTGAWDTDYCLS